MTIPPGRTQPQSRLHLELTQDFSSSQDSIDEVRSEARSGQVRSGPSFQGFVRMTETSLGRGLVSRSHSNIDNLRKEQKLIPVKTVPNICKLT